MDLAPASRIAKANFKNYFFTAPACMQMNTFAW